MPIDVNQTESSAPSTQTPAQGNTIRAKVNEGRRGEDHREGQDADVAYVVRDGQHDDAGADAEEEPEEQEGEEPTWDLECILEERLSTHDGACRTVVLRSLGGLGISYSPSWETWRRWGTPGTPLETWEPLMNVRGTVGLRTRAGWRSARRRRRSVVACPTQSDTVRLLGRCLYASGADGGGW